MQFFVYQRRIQIKGNDAVVGSMTMTVDRRMMFERLSNLSRAQVADVRLLVLSFWTELSLKCADLQRVQDIGTAINKAIGETHLTFKELLGLAPQSTSVLRLYADFLLELATDPSKAAELLSDAEQIEDDQSKAHATSNDQDIVFGGLCDVDLSSETISWLKISAEPSKLGFVVDAQQQRAEVVGIPTPRRDRPGNELPPT